MSDVVRRSARAILLDGEELVLIKRTKPGREPYWVTVGGGVEADDDTIEAALHREVFEELGGTVDRAELVYLITDQLSGGIGVQYIFAARLVTMDLTARTGTEFSKPERGAYEVVRVPFTCAGPCRLLGVTPTGLPCAAEEYRVSCRRGWPAPPFLELVDGALDCVAVFVERGVVAALPDACQQRGPGRGLDVRMLRRRGGLRARRVAGARGGHRTPPRTLRRGDGGVPARPGRREGAPRGALGQRASRRSGAAGPVSAEADHGAVQLLLGERRRR